MGKQTSASYDEKFQNNPPSEVERFFKSINKKPEDNPMYNVYKASSTSLLGVNTGFGKSDYDKDINWFSHVNENDPNDSINEFRYNEQSGFTQLGTGVLRAGLKAGIEIAKMPGYIGGAVAAIGAEEGQGWETFVDNQWLKTLNNLNEEINTEYLPVYVGKAIREGSIWDNLSATSFYATDGADGVGYIASMFFPGAVFKGLGLGHKAMGLTAKGMRFINGEQKLAGAVRSLTDAGITANKFDIVGTALANTLMEAAAEGNGASVAFKADVERRKSLQPGELGYLTEQEAEELLKTQLPSLIKNTVLSNAAILIGPTLLQSSMIWGKAGNKLLSKIDNPSTLTKLGNRGKDLLKATGSEAVVEEAGQATVETMFSNSAKKGELTGSFFNDFNIGELADNYLDTVTSVEGQKAMFLGAFLGGGMSMYQGAKQDISDRKRTNEVLGFSKPLVDNFNTIMETDIYKKNEDGDIEFDYNNKPKLDPVKVMQVAKALQFTEAKQKQFEQAVKDGNTEVVEELKQEAITQLIIPFISQGEIGVQALEQHLKETSKAEDLQGLKKPEEIEKIIKDAVSQAKYMQSQLTSYEDFSKDLIELYHPNATKEDYVSEYNNIRDLYLNLKGSEFSQKRKLEDLERQKADLIKDVGEENLMTRTNEIVDENAADDMFKYKYEMSPRLKLLNDKIENSKNVLKELDKFVNNHVWNSKDLNKRFKDVVEQNNKVRETVTEENEKATEAALTQIKEATTEEQLENLPKVNDDVDAILKQKADEKAAELKQLEENRLQEELEAKEEARILKERDDAEALRKLNESKAGDIVVNPTTNEEVVVVSNEGNVLTVKDDITGEVETIVTINDSTDDISANEGFVEDVKNNKEVSDKANFSLPSKFNESFKSFVDFMMKPFNKKGQIMNLDLNLDGLTVGSNSDNAITNYNNFLKGISPLDKNLLYQWLPLKMSVDKTGESSWSRYPGSKETYENYSETFTLRKNIIDAIANGNSLQDIQITIAGQSAPKFNTKFENGKPAKNNPLEIKEIKGKKISELEMYHVDLQGKLTPVTEGALENPSAESTEKMKQGRGNIYVTIKNLFGIDTPVKLNFGRLETLAAPLVDIYEYILKHAETELLSTQTLSQLSLEGSEYEDAVLYDNIKQKLGTVIDILGGNESEITLEQIIEVLVLEESGDSSRLGIIQNESGQYVLDFKNEKRYTYDDLLNPLIKDEIVNTLATSKNRNVITVNNKLNKTTMDFKNEKYVEYLFNTKGLTTDIDTSSNSHTFKAEDAAIWLEPTVKTKKANSSKPTQLAGVNPNESTNNTAELAELEKSENKPKINLSRLKEINDNLVEAFKATQNSSMNNNLPFVQIENIDEKFKEALQIVVTSQQASASLIQRKLKTGYNRASLLIDQLETAGVVGEFKGSKGREVLITDINQASAFFENKPEEIRNSQENVVSLQTNDRVDPESGLNASTDLTSLLENIEDLKLKINSLPPKSGFRATLAVKLKEKQELLETLKGSNTNNKPEFQMEADKEGTIENKQVIQAKVENTLSIGDQKREITQLTLLNNSNNKAIASGQELPVKLKEKFEELKQKYAEEFAKLPKKC